MKSISPSGESALTVFEALRLKAYRDSVGVLTIGVGHTAAAGPPKPVAGMTITREEAFDILARDLDQYEAAVNKRLPMIPQHVFDGAVSFCFNVGVGGFRKASWPTKYLAGNMVSAEAALKSWNQAGGHVLPGLINRRAQEADMIFRGKYPLGLKPPSGVAETDAPPVQRPTTPTEDNPPAPAPTVPVGAGGVAAIGAGASIGDWALVALGVVALVVAVVIYIKRRG